MTKREIRPAMPPAAAVTMGGVVRRCAAGSSAVIVWRSLLEVKIKISGYTEGFI